MRLAGCFQHPCQNLMFLFWRVAISKNLIKSFSFNCTMSTARGSRKRTAKEAAAENGSPKPKKLLNCVDSDIDGVVDIKQKFNLKILTFNVAGVRACIKKNCIEYLEKEDADIICLNVSLIHKKYIFYIFIILGNEML